MLVDAAEVERVESAGADGDVQGEANPVRVVTAQIALDLYNPHRLDRRGTGEEGEGGGQGERASAPMPHCVARMT